MLTKSERHLANFGQSWPILAMFCQTLVNIGQQLANVGQCWGSFAKQVVHKLPTSCRRVADNCRKVVDDLLREPSFGQNSTHTSSVGPDFGRFGPMFGKPRPTLADVGQMLAEVDHNLAKHGQQ